MHIRNNFKHTRRGVVVGVAGGVVMRGDGGVVMGGARGAVRRAGFRGHSILRKYFPDFV